MHRLARLFAAVLCAGLASCGAATQVQSGRLALLVDKPEEALSRFEAAAATDPDYVMQSGPFREGLWTYIGRAQYATGKFTEARASLERAVSVDRDDQLAKIYLGLTLARSGDRSKGLQEIHRGMKELYDWLEYLMYNSSFGRYWDPSREIRSQIEKDLAMIASGAVDWEKLIANAEWLGKRTEEEVDHARRDEQQRLRDRFDRRRGILFGAGF